MKSRIPVLALILSVAGWVNPAAADLSLPKLTLSSYVGSGNLDSSYGVDGMIPIGARAGFIVSRYFGLEGSYGKVYGESERVPNREYPLDQWGVDLLLNLFPNSRFNPYILGGWAQLNLDEPVVRVVRMPGAEFGAGVKFRFLQDSGARWDFRLDVRNVLSRNVWPLDDSGDYKNHLFVTGGITMTLANPDRDSDGDGVLDRFDRCPGTTAGASVDPFGCQLDYDQDGVPDGLDECPATPQGALVDDAGCPSDSDNDGVVDGVDLCDDTMPGVLVDAAGCATDTDGDGVFDGLDLCPRTPPRILVDEFGCPLTPTVSAAEVELLNTGTLVLTNVPFEDGTATLKPEALAQLDEVGAILVKWSELEVEIGGHTGGRGDAAANLALSADRAQAVLDYWLKNFLALGKARFQTKGFGDSQPIAPASTADGRRRNQRIELRVKNPAVLQRLR